jgi:hypothetical protein
MIGSFLTFILEKDANLGHNNRDITVNVLLPIFIRQADGGARIEKALAQGNCKYFLVCWGGFQGKCEVRGCSMFNPISIDNSLWANTRWLSKTCCIIIERASTASSALLVDSLSISFRDRLRDFSNSSDGVSIPCQDCQHQSKRTLVHF